jgi:hypothetical protein
MRAAKIAVLMIINKINQAQCDWLLCSSLIQFSCARMIAQQHHAPDPLRGAWPFARMAAGG